MPAIYYNLIFPPSHKGAIWNTVPFNYNSARDGPDGVKCAKVQLHLQ